MLLLLLAQPLQQLAIPLLQQPLLLLLVQQLQ